MPVPATSGTRIQRVHEAKTQIDQQLHELAVEMAQGKSERLVRYLEFCAQFHPYSFGNLMLALAQCPTLTRIAGIRQWNRLGRRVKAGEQGILILAPQRVRKQRKPTAESEDANEAQRVKEETKETVVLFRPVYVFDVSQTEGEPLPEIITAQGDTTACYPALEAAVTTVGITLEYVEFIPGLPGAEGVSLGQRILVVHQESPAVQFRILAHEFAHELLHKTAEREGHTVRETEADAVAYVVCRHYGIACDTSDYLLLHDSNPKLLLVRLRPEESVDIALDLQDNAAVHGDADFPLVVITLHLVQPQGRMARDLQSSTSCLSALVWTRSGSRC